MADFETMRTKHREDSVKWLTVLIFVLIILYFEKQYSNMIYSLINNPSESYDLANFGFVIFLTIAVPVGTYLIFLVTIARQDYYYTIDNYFFKKRGEVDKFICLELINIQSPLEKQDAIKIQAIRDLVNKDGKIGKLMNIFYKYIEKPEIVNPELKNQAFIYWGDYFSSITFIFFGVIFLLIYVIMTVVDFSILKVIVMALIACLLIVNYRGISKGKISKKLYEIPKEQVEQIHQKAKDDLLEDIRIFKCE